jgi:DNA invertase Pin-like site-specific DNA recombinase
MNDLQPRVFHYARASTRKQEASPETQKETALKYALFNNLGDVTHFVDAATTGKIPWQERDAGQALFRQLRTGDHVILAKLDRAFRKLSDCVTVLEKFETMGVKLHICNLMGGAIDLSSPMGRFMIHILAAFAELERAFISERTRDGIRNRKHRGFKHSRHPGYGFRWEKRILRGKVERVRVPDDDERNVMRVILRYRMQENPLSWKEIADHLTDDLKLKTKDNGPWGVNRVRRACEAELNLQLREQRGDS